MRASTVPGWSGLAEVRRVIAGPRVAVLELVVAALERLLRREGWCAQPERVSGSEREQS